MQLSSTTVSGSLLLTCTRTVLRAYLFSSLALFTHTRRPVAPHWTHSGSSATTVHEPGALNSQPPALSTPLDTLAPLPPRSTNPVLSTCSLQPIAPHWTHAGSSAAMVHEPGASHTLQTPSCSAPHQTA
ncbi:hypothetical protein L798_09954 [Zootermopsis nevadensis]|uniref:Uncharacterized protein n=1 Tax=Zootermopsis nevadensis TaxID=136037 RepID=A0A067RCM5_ZOONE|nr:hypothetical protein L798_09954 [Zootermopsis nevadensis]